jgi:hypothetical protein
MNPFRNTKTTADTYAKLLQQFPKIKFSYELKSYKKVSNSSNEPERNDNNVYFMIPKGKKYFVWFKNGECLFLELDNDKQVVNVTSKKTSRIFPNDTILYGTHFYYRPHMNANTDILYYFTIENIHYYNGVNLDATQTVFEKCKTLHLAFTTVSLEKTFQIEIGLPHIDTCLDRISAVKPFYQVYCIQKKNSNDKTNQYQNVRLNAASSIQKNDVKQQPQEEIKTSVVTVSKHIPVENSKKYVEKSNDYSSNNCNNNSNNNISNNYNINNNNKKYKIFIVSADIQNDIYNLVDPDHDDSSNYTISNKLVASIPDYKTSVFMNALFRNIKENRSLDALEESDDEDEFENTNIDKFVDLTKKIKMKCIFNYKFKKWTPIECVK